MCLRHPYVICIDIQLLYTKHNSLLNSTGDLFWVAKKTKKCTTRKLRLHAINGCSIFNNVFYMFLWSNCYTIFTVLPETQKLYLPAISHWSVHKIPRKKNRETYFWDDPYIDICDCPGRNRPHMSKWWFSLFSGILFSEPLKLSRNQPEVLELKTEVTLKVISKKTFKILKNVRNFYFKSYSVFLPEPPVKIHCRHFFVFWAMIHQVLRSYVVHYRIFKNHFQIQINSSYHVT